MNVRAIAAKILAAVVKDKRSLTELYRDALPASLSARDRSLVKEYCYGSLRWHDRLQIIAAQLIYKPLKSRDQDVSELLLLGLYQLIYLQTPSYAAVSETVAATQLLKKPWAKGLINQALRKFLRDADSFQKKADAGSVGRYAHPQWLIKKLQSAWPDQWQDILAANNRVAPMFLRVNIQQTTVGALQQLLQKNHMETSFIPDLHQALRLIKPQPVHEIPGFEEGLFSVQDLASQYVVPLLNLSADQHVLDACAAPGGKTAHILETLPSLTKLVAIERDPIRLELIKENLNRLKIPENSLTLIQADAADTKAWWDGQQFDRILLDAPCSGTGVIRRHPDIKILRKNEDIPIYSQQQMNLLLNLWPLLKPGGLLLYTTCSVLPEENELLIQQFCSNHSDAQPIPISISHGVSQTIGRQLLPQIEGHDGFYYALLQKTCE